MKKYPFGFTSKIADESNGNRVQTAFCESVEPKKSVVQVYFPSRGLTLAYYNDSFDLKVGDNVYVDGKLEGHRGQVREVSYSFKIKLSDYKRVVALVDTNVNGDLYIAGDHLVAFDRTVIPYEKVITWFKAPENDVEYVSGSDYGKSFPLDNLHNMNISQQIADRGFDYYVQNRVSYICIDGTQGRAIVEGSECYEIEFIYQNGEISNLTCSCFCSYSCKHEFAAMLQLQMILDYITNNYDKEYGDYFAAIRKTDFMNTALCKEYGKISVSL